MPIVIPMRHAHAELASPGMRDFDRQLSKIGKAEAILAAQFIAKENLTLTRIFCSPARRTIETLECLNSVLSTKTIETIYNHEFYSGDENSYQQALCDLAQNDVALLIGHNPMVERFALNLVRFGEEPAFSLIKQGFPTAAFAIVELDSNNAQGRLRNFHIASV